MELTYVVMNTVNNNHCFGLLYVGHDFEQAVKARVDCGLNHSRMMVFVGNEIIAEVFVSPEGFQRAYD